MDKGILLNSTIAFLEDKPVVTELQHRIKYPVTGANESNILALALATQENRDTLLQDTIYLHVDEGLGIGIICNGSLLTGSHNQGGEISHMPVSYTHLDVYKRQVLTGGGQQPDWHGELGRHVPDE